MKGVNMPLKALVTELQAVSRDGLSLQRRLFAVLLLFLFAVMLGILLILFATGVFSAGLHESELWFKNELAHIADGVDDEFGTLAIEGVHLSEKLSANLEKSLLAQEIPPTSFNEHPEILNDLLRGSFDVLRSGLEKSRCSGAYFMLDATINPSLPDSEHSKVGLYLKYLEPNTVSFPSIRFLRGPAIIAREQNMTMSLYWKQELPAPEGGLFSRVAGAARTSKQPLSRLYCWNPRTALEGDYEQIMLLGVPMRTSDGTVLGMCGYDVSAMLFKHNYTPDNGLFTHAFAMLVPIDAEDRIDASGALFAGGYTAISSLDGALSIQPGTLNTYRTDDGTLYSGKHREIKVYPEDSAFAGEKWALCLLVPKADLDAQLAERNWMVVSLLSLLLMLAVAAAALVSRGYIKPVVQALNLLKTGNQADITKTRIPEIDDLIEFLTAQDQKEVSVGLLDNQLSAPAFSMFDDFESGINTLSPAERAVFNLYMEGYDAKKIAGILYLSINTIKTHNKRIYMKLNVSSRSELMVYVNMLREKEGLCVVQRDE